MTSPPGLEPDRIQALRAAVETEPDQSAAEAGAPQHAARSVKSQAKGVLRRVLNRFVGWYVRDVAAAVLTEGAADLQRLRLDVERYTEQNQDLATLPVNFELLKGEVAGLHSTTANLDLLKAEVRQLKVTLDEIGAAIAPGVGLGGVAERFGELRHQLNALARQVRSMPSAAGTANDTPSGDRLAAQPVATSSFDYVGLERRFRGESEQILAIAKDRYLDLVRDHQPVLDVGCGRGELVGALIESGVEAVGVDLDAGMVEEARARGVAAHLGDAVSYLREQPEGAFGAIVSIQVVEHLPFEVLNDLVEVAASRLKPGGLLVIETPNPLTLYVLGNTFLLDPTHVRPIHPSLLVFLCERAGFAEIEVRYESPLTSHRLEPIDGGPDAPAWIAELNESLQRLNDVLFGPQDYAVIAKAPSPPGSL